MGIMSIITDKVKSDFAQRLNQAMDEKGYPVRGRANVLSQIFDISNKGAGKWLKGEALPETSKFPVLADLLGVKTEWLLSGGSGKDTKGQDEATPSGSTLKNDYLLKVRLFEQRFAHLIANNQLSEEHLKIIDGMIDGLNSTVTSWLLSKHPFEINKP